MSLAGRELEDARATGLAQPASIVEEEQATVRQQARVVGLPPRSIHRPGDLLALEVEDGQEVGGAERDEDVPRAEGGRTIRTGPSQEADRVGMV